MIKILFICHGNICRSPMAEFIMKKLVLEKGLSEEFIISSAATSNEELGNPIYPPAVTELSKHNISITYKKTSVKLSRDDYNKYDYLVCMDNKNLINAMKIFGSDPSSKLSLLKSYSGKNDDVADPWYSGKFDRAFYDIFKGCSDMLEYLLENQHL